MELSHQNTGNVENASMISGEAEAFAGIILATANADGDITEEEKKFLGTIFRRMKLFKEMPKEGVNSLVKRLYKIIHKEEDVSKFIEMCQKALRQELCETAFAVSVDLILADGKMIEKEKEFIYQLKDMLKIEYQLAMKIIEVIIIKNRDMLE